MFVGVFLEISVLHEFFFTLSKSRRSLYDYRLDSDKVFMSSRDVLMKSVFMSFHELS